jgi:hypothetical protein
VEGFEKAGNKANKIHKWTETFQIQMWSTVRLMRKPHWTAQNGTCSAIRLTRVSQIRWALNGLYKNWVNYDSDQDTR